MQTFLTVGVIIVGIGIIGYYIFTAIRDVIAKKKKAEIDKKKEEGGDN